MGGTLSCGGRGHRPKDDDTRPYSAPVTKTNGIVAPSEKYIVPAGKFNALHAGKMFMIFVFIITFFKIFFRELQKVGPGLGPNCLPRAVDDKFRRE